MPPILPTTRSRTHRTPAFRRLQTTGRTLLLWVATLAWLGASGCELGVTSASSPHGEAEAQPHAEAEPHAAGEHAHKIIVTSPIRTDVDSTQSYVCRIRSCQHIELRSLNGGYLEELHFKEGQAVQKGDLMFKILPVLYKARYDSEIAEVNRSQIEVDNAVRLADKGIVSPQEVALKKAALAKAQAKVELAQAELSFTEIRAPFNGIVDRQLCQLGSLIEEGDVLTTISDNSVMWAYFNVPEKRYLEYKAELDQEGVAGSSSQHLTIELKLANQSIFPQKGKIGAIEADFNVTTGNIAFRADFPNAEGLLRNGQTGTIVIHRELSNVIVIPQRATFEILARRYAYVVDENNVVHQRDIKVQSEQDDIFVISEGLNESDKIIFEGIRQVRDGDHIEFDFHDPHEALKNLKYHAE